MSGIWRLVEPERLETSAAGEAGERLPLDPPDTPQIHGIACVMLIGGSWREQVLFAGVMKELLSRPSTIRDMSSSVREWGVRAYCVSFPLPVRICPPPAGAPRY